MKDFSKIGSRLSKIKKEKPFTTPANYFEELPSRIHRSISEKEKKQAVLPSKLEHLWQTLKPRLALVAIIAGFAFFGYHGFRFITSPEPSEVTQDQIAEFIDLHYYNYSYTLLLSEFGEEELIEDFYLEDEESEAYIDYLTAESDIEIYYLVAEYY